MIAWNRTMAGRRSLRGSVIESVMQFVRPQATLAAMTLLAAAPIVLVAVFVPRPLVLPVVSLIAIATAGLAALLAWLIQTQQRSNTLTTWDVAGACALIGCAAAMLSEPENVIGLLGAQ
jgi:hypothetical protein